MHKIIECIACNNKSTINGGNKSEQIPLCGFHFNDIISEELVDDLAREIYMKDWLIPKKNGQHQLSKK